MYWNLHLPVHSVSARAEVADLVVKDYADFLRIMELKDQDNEYQYTSPEERRCIKLRQKGEV